MPNRFFWNPDYSVGNDTLDSQHRAILAQCNTLADCIVDAGPQADQEFQTVLNALMAMAAEHFSAEEAMLSQWGYPELQAQQDEHDEFDYLANEIITTENFEKIELQRFLALWWIGHIVGSAKKYRAFLQQQVGA